MSDNVIDIITRQVVEKVGSELESRADAVVQAVVDRVEQEAWRRIDAAVADIPQVAIRTAEQALPAQLEVMPLDVKADARDRAWRTLAQGLVVTVLLSIVTAFGTAVGSPTFDMLTWDSWRAAATAGGTAAVMAVAAYIQRLLVPPKGQ